MTGDNYFIICTLYSRIFYTRYFNNKRVIQCNIYYIYNIYHRTMRAQEQLNVNDLKTTHKYSLILVIPHYVLLKLLHFIHIN